MAAQISGPDDPGTQDSRLVILANEHNLISVRESYRRQLLEFRKEFELHDSLFVLIASEHREKNREFVERLARELPVAPNLNTLFGDGQEQPQHELYLTFDRGRIYVLMALAKDSSHEKAAIKQLRKWIAQTRVEVPGVNAKVTGEAVLRHDEMEQARHDTEVAARCPATSPARLTTLGVDLVMHAGVLGGTVGVIADLPTVIASRADFQPV